ncbi:hypothetical protein GN958_ATG13850 [Phytophthora infestans]|uniref:Uncharacterized protein n=1 Tax=Phytophthora infestans TaxID=4787 RepID=A0A8S9U9C5_PHYIN|nr:hypothetical protein GN958_ATG13850 [Phytophthora infestans]
MFMTTLGANEGSIEYSSVQGGHQWEITDGEKVMLEYLVDAEDGVQQSVTVPLCCRTTEGEHRCQGQR